MTLSDVAIRRPVFTAMISLGIVVLGVMSFLRLGVDLFPDVQFPVVAITTIYPGASPSEVESQVTETLEEQLVSLNGIDTMISKSRESVSFVLLQFELDVDVEVAAAQVRERVSQARIALPREIEEPSVTRFDVSAAPIMVYTLSGQMDVQSLYEYADDVLRPALEQVDGVATIRIRGGRERQVNVLLDLEKLEALHLTPLAIVEKIRMENLNVPAGSYGEGRREITVRTLGEVRSVEELGRIVVATGMDGTLVRLSDVATVEDGFVDEDTRVRTNGQPAVVFEVLKTSGRNTVEVSEAVKERLATMQFPRSVRPALIVDQSEFILENAHEVEIALVFGGAMAILVILFFMLDLRSTFISGLALPTSVIGTFALMYALDFTLNMMTLLGLSLAIGLLIDDAIVVRENIMKHLERGEDPVSAAQKGTREITLAVVATTLTICAVFVPVAFMGGLVGQFFQQFGLTVAAATVLSMWVAFTLDPMLSARLARVHKPGEREPFTWLKRPFRWVFAWLDGSYHSLLAWMLAKKRRMALGLLAGFGALIGSCSLVPLMGVEFVAPEDRAQYVLDLELPAGTSLHRTSELSAGVEQALLRDPYVRTVYSTIGPDGDSHRARWRVVLVPKWERSVGLPEMKDRARTLVRQHLGASVEVAVSDPAFIEGGEDAPIMIFVRGENLTDLEATANRFAGVLRSIPGATDVDVDWAPGKPELQLAIRRDRAANLGVPAALIAGTLRASLEGELAGIYRDAGDEVDIRVRLSDEDRESAANIARVPIPTRGGFVPLSDVATLSRGDGP
ncbi:MAG: efflux RND transporter permease subunit, partial [Deltaproteobacteria bacterium]|nr:efflux RND transporter permease subunit [Deltaproteobacteria bacterium]